MVGTVNVSLVKGLWKLPTDWVWVKLEDVLKLEYGKSLIASKRVSSGRYPVFGSSGQVGIHDSAITKSPAIIIGRKGSIGVVFFSDNPCWAIDTTYYLDEFPPYIYPKYIYYFLKILGLDKLNRAAAIPGLSRNDVYAFSLPIPSASNPNYSLDIQRRIVARLEALLEEVRVCRSFINKTRQDVEQLMGTALSEVIDKLDKQYPNSPTISELISSKNIQIEGGGTPSRNNENYWKGLIPWVSPKDMKRWYISDAQEHISEAALQETSVKLIPQDSVLVVVRGMILAHTFPVSITQTEVTINQDMKAIVPKNNLLPDYLGYILRTRSPSILQQVETAAHGTKRLKTETLMQVVIPMPSKSEQVAIVEYLNYIQYEVDKIVEKLEQDAKLLDYLEQSILERAFRGEL